MCRAPTDAPHRALPARYSSAIYILPSADRGNQPSGKPHESHYLTGISTVMFLRTNRHCPSASSQR
jgi:hypothetical protein